MNGRQEELGLFPYEMGYEFVSEIVIRPKPEFFTFEANVKAQYPRSKVATIDVSSDADWPKMAQEVERLLSFPSRVEHSFQAMYEMISDLSWLSNGHFVILLRMSDQSLKSYSIINGINMIMKGISEQNRHGTLRITLVLFL
jgi:hypothetical protein